MNDVKSNIIQSVTKVIESAQSGYATNGLPTRSPENQQTQTLTLVVLANRQNQILLQEQTGGRRIALEKDALSGSIASSLSKGDKLVLINNTNSVANFKVLKAEYQQSPTTPFKPIQSLATNTLTRVINELSAQWPQISPSLLKQSSAVVLNQVLVSANSTQANTLISAVLDIAKGSGQPALKFETIASISFVGANNKLDVLPSNAIGIQLKISRGNNTSTLLNIPITNELRQGLSNGQSVKLSINANNSSVISEFVIGKNASGNFVADQQAKVSQASLNIINQALNKNTSALKQTFSGLIVSPNSTSLQSGIIISPSVSNLNALGANLKQSISEGISSNTLSDAKLLLSFENKNNSQIGLRLLAKPIIVPVANQLLAGINSERLSTRQSNLQGNNLEKVDLTRSATKPQNQSILSKDALLDTKPSRVNDKLLNKLIASLSANGASPETINKTTVLLKSAISDELNQALPRAENLSKTLPKLVEQLQYIQKNAGSELKALITSTIKQINAVINTGDTPYSNSMASSTAQSTYKDTESVGFDSLDTTALKSLMSSSLASGLLQTNMTSDASARQQNNLVNALVTMLQASLQARLIGQRPQLLNTLLQAAPTAALQSKVANNTKPAQSQTKLLQDIQKADPRGNLIGELNKVLSQHSLQKLRSVESTMQGQDTFYYTLPNMFSPQQKDIELVIRRQEQAPEKEQANTQQAWQLSMKLEIGDMGDVLAKVKLINNSLDLNLYASNQALKNKILDYLPYLERRFTSLGLNTKPTCFVGKLPNTLHKNDFQVVQAYV